MRGLRSPALLAVLPRSLPFRAESISLQNDVEERRECECARKRLATDLSATPLLSPSAVFHHRRREEGVTVRGYRFACAGEENCVSVKSGPPIDSEQPRADRLTPSFAYVHPYQPVFLSLSLSLPVFLLLFLLFFRVNSMCLAFKNPHSSKGLAWCIL